MHSKYDLLIIGAGPGGLSSAVSARLGLRVLLVNEQAHLGGQIYHSVETVSKSSRIILGGDFQYGDRLVSEFKASHAEYSPGTCVLSIDSDRSACCMKDDKLFEVKADQIIICSGAMERPVPIPGWTLPGVMGAASVDILFKQSDMVPSGRVIFAGSGPLMLSVACHMVDCGVKIAAILDTSSFKNTLGAIAHGPAALSNPGLLVKGLAMLQKIRKAGIPVIKDASGVRAMGDQRVEAVSFEHRGKVKTLETDLLLLHEGLIPNTQLSRLAGCDHEWQGLHQYWKPVRDKWGRSSVDGISLVGDCTGILGAKAAEHSGYIAGINAAYHARKITKQQRDHMATPHFSALKKEGRIRPFIDALYPPNREMIIPRDPDTIICRCEEVRLSDILAAIEKGYQDPAALKNSTRSGMGRCQGRMCGTVVTQILAEKLSKEPRDIGHYNIRSMLKPLTIAQLAGMEEYRPGGA